MCPCPRHGRDRTTSKKDLAVRNDQRLSIHSLTMGLAGSFSTKQHSPNPSHPKRKLSSSFDQSVIQQTMWSSACLLEILTIHFSCVKGVIPFLVLLLERSPKQHHVHNCRTLTLHDYIPIKALETYSGKRYLTVLHKCNWNVHSGTFRLARLAPSHLNPLLI